MRFRRALMIGGLLPGAVLLAVTAQKVDPLASAIRGCAAGVEHKFILLDLRSFSPIEAYDECGAKLSRQPADYFSPVGLDIIVRDVSSTGTSIVVDNWSRFDRGFLPMAELWTLDGIRPKKWVQGAPSSIARISPNLALTASVGQLDLGPKGKIRGLFLKTTSGTYTDADAPGWNRVVVMDIDEESAKAGQQISWSPASDRVATTIGGRIAIVRIPDGQVEYIAEGRSPKWSPDGLQMAYESPASELVIRDMKSGSERKPLIGKKVEGSCLEWSPDMKLLSLCEIPDEQPDPRNRVLVYVGILRLQDGTYTRSNRWSWGRNHDYRWLKSASGGLEGLMNLLEKIRSTP